MHFVQIKIKAEIYLFWKPYLLKIISNGNKQLFNWSWNCLTNLMFHLQTWCCLCLFNERFWLYILFDIFCSVQSGYRLPDPYVDANWVIKEELNSGNVWKVNMSFPDYVTKFRRKMVEIRSRFRDTARLGLYADYWVPPIPSSFQPSS